jgi:hypothetical protein
MNRLIGALVLSFAFGSGASAQEIKQRIDALSNRINSNGLDQNEINAAYLMPDLFPEKVGGQDRAKALPAYPLFSKIDQAFVVSVLKTLSRNDDRELDKLQELFNFQTSDMKARYPYLKEIPNETLMDLQIIQSIAALKAGAQAQGNSGSERCWWPFCGKSTYGASADGALDSNGIADRFGVPNSN